jgi:hypothetical protein
VRRYSTLGSARAEGQERHLSAHFLTTQTDGNLLPGMASAEVAKWQNWVSGLCATL